jgi:hypothetical protein
VAAPAAVRDVVDALDLARPVDPVAAGQAGAVLGEAAELDGIFQARIAVDDALDAGTSDCRRWNRRRTLF